MSKFYAQCGPVRVVLTADSAERAALVMADHALQPHLWVYDDTGLTEQDRIDHLMLEALLHLETTIRVSERGFDRADAETFGTPDTILHWHKLIVGINRLYAAAGLIPRSLHRPTAATDGPGTSPAAPQTPR